MSWNKQQEEVLTSLGVKQTLIDLTAELCKSKPTEPVPFMIKYLQKQQQIKKEAVVANTTVTAMETEDNNNDEEMEEETAKRYVQSRKARRGAVSSEPIAIADVDSFELPKFAKSDEILNHISSALEKNVLFAHLDADERGDLYGAMEKVSVSAGNIIIKQGDEGDYFYVVDSGTCEIWVDSAGTPIKVMTCKKWDSFGELALIYNTPRAATVKATTDCVLWRIDRITYRKIIMGSQVRKRRLYESFLEKVPILSTLQKYERLTVADALEPALFKEGDIIISQGDPGDAFYIIVEGEVKVTKVTPASTEPEEVARLFTSSYFGEIALMTDRPRAATVTAAKKLQMR
eukprot:TRINITY_DN1290_c0_g1_i1.p1 TRINITY_DN1290_c0_g1~~TRINITY_DN1290_c0_g1_i1.p1  ORF type:complete len:346 (-),score=73.13 TRINITY_DN1290_c0_g1_i1:159-1196(-)